MELKIIYEDENVIVVDKPAGILTCQENENGMEKGPTIIDILISKNPELKKTGSSPRYGVVHRLDRDTSGILLVAKNQKSLLFFQKQFINKTVEKRYLALVEGWVKGKEGQIETLISRSPSNRKKQKVYLPFEPHPVSARKAITKYKVIQTYKIFNRKPEKGKFTLLEIKTESGRRHQIRCHLSYLKHPIAGDKLYSFKDSVVPPGLSRQFLHAHFLKITLPNGQVKEFKSELPKDLQEVLNKLTPQEGLCQN